MILDKFRQTPGFPFEEYFENIEHYSQAQIYWLAVLRHAVGFENAHWTPRSRPVDLADDMYNGLVIDVENLAQQKQIYLCTNSLPADINMALRENGPMDAADIPKEIDEQTRARIIAGIPEDTLRSDTAAHYKPFMAWVEQSDVWIAKPGHPEGGLLKPVERLIVNAEISERGEPLALQAIESFIAEGSAKERVNSVFAPPE